MTAKLTEIIHDLEIRGALEKAEKAYLNRETGEIVRFTDEDLARAEDEKAIEVLPERHQKIVLQAIAILRDRTGTWVDLPDASEIDTYGTMRAFIEELTDPRIAEDLAGAIRSRNALRKFLKSISLWNIEQSWVDFRREALREIAIAWCEENAVEYIDF